MMCARVRYHVRHGFTPRTALRRACLRCRACAGTSRVRADQSGRPATLMTARLLPGNDTIRKLDVRKDVSPIAFASKRDGNWEIYVMDAAGTSRRLTRREGEDRFPLWSPDRTRIAFGSTTGRTADGWDLWVMEVDGGNARKLHSGIVAKSQRGWSRDGKRIAFAAIADGNTDIYIVEVDSGRATRLTATTGEDRDPSWSPDGERLALSSTRDENCEIYLMRADGSDVRRLTNDPASDDAPVWSPDGTAIAFVSHRGSNPDLYVIQPDGHDLERLTVGASVTKDASRWSPDGSHLAFQMARGQNYDIGVIRLRDRRRTDVARSPAYDGMFAWSPDGTELAFISSRDGVDALYRTDVVGERTVRLTDTPSLNPAWARCGCCTGSPAVDRAAA
jgi:Tol biopolymer transport system component